MVYGLEQERHIPVTALLQGFQQPIMLLKQQQVAETAGTAIIRDLNGVPTAPTVVDRLFIVRQQ
jgi:hypothetical protein